MCSAADGHLGCFQVFAIMNRVSMNFHEQFFVWTYAFFHLEDLPRSGMLHC